MNCAKCGQPIDGDIKYCQFCGNETAKEKIPEMAGAPLQEEQHLPQNTLPTVDELQRHITYTKVSGNPALIPKLQQTGGELPQGNALTGVLKAEQEQGQKDRQKKLAFAVIGWLSFVVSLFIEPILLPILGIGMGFGCYKYDKKQGLLLIAVNALWLCYTLFAPLLKMFRRDSIGTLV